MNLLKKSDAAATVVTSNLLDSVLLSFCLNGLGFTRVETLLDDGSTVRDVLHLNPSLCLLALPGGKSLDIGLQIRREGFENPLLISNKELDSADNGVVRALFPVFHLEDYLISSLHQRAMLTSLEPTNGNGSENGVDDSHENASADLQKRTALLGSASAIEPVFAEYQAVGASKSIFFKIGDDYKSIPLMEIAYFYADNKVTFARVRDRNYPTNVKLKAIEEFFSWCFVRIHRTYLVNINSIDSVKTRDNAILVGGELLPVGQYYRKQLMDRLLMFK
jgi:hypothetical protein